MVAAGTSEEVAQVEASFTGQYFREKLGMSGVIKEALSLSDRLRTQIALPGRLEHPSTIRRHRSSDATIKEKNGRQ